MKKIEGLVSKKTILYWLENYEYLAAGDRPPEAPAGNSGPKAYDGVSAMQLNKLMLDQAIANLPKLTKACVKARWLRKFTVNRTCKVLDIEKSIYYNRCKQGVDLIYKEINGERSNYKALIDKILQDT